MVLIRLLILLLVALASSFAASLLSSAWRKKKKSDPETLRIEAMLPGYDCGLCGSEDCPSYAFAIDQEGEDPALCSPGGSRLEARIRSLLAEREGDQRAVASRAVVRCGGREDSAAAAFPYDGRRDCNSAFAMYGGPKRCKAACLGLGSCVEVCTRGAIRLSSGLAIVKPSLCTGCGDCLKVCPTAVLSLVPRNQFWYVACSSRREARLKEADCSVSCTACGECSIRSGRSEFILEGQLARENSESTGGKWAKLAACCPTGAIALAGGEKKRPSPFPKNGR